jgi:hypothetical protein
VSENRFPRFEAEILALVAADCFLPVLAANNAVRLVSDIGRPIRAADILAQVSLVCERPTQCRLPRLAAPILSLVAGSGSRPLTPPLATL